MSLAEHLMISRCPICSGSTTSVGVTVAYFIAALKETVNIDFSACIACGFVFQANPVAWSSLRAYYQASPRYRSAEGDSWDRVLCRNQLHFFETAGPLRGARVLDVGADMGKMLDLLAASYGCTTAFIEENETALHHLRSRGLHREITSLEADDQFDWCILSEVLEHIVNPVEYLKELGNHIDASGRLFIEVPNHSFWDDRDYGFSFEHVNYFTPESLTSTLRRSGFIVTKLEVTSDERYFQGRVRIIRAVATRMPNQVRAELITAVTDHYAREFGGRFRAAKQLANRHRNGGRPGLALYGAGELADLLLMNAGVTAEDIVGVFDSDRKKSGLNFHGFMVKPPEHIQTSGVTAILILSGAEATIADHVRAIGYQGAILGWSELDTGVSPPAASVKSPA